MIKETIVVDLDGTLANIEHRVHLVKKEKPEWDKFYSECDKDVPNKWCVELITCMLSQGFEVIVVSARRKTEEKKTMAWMGEVFGKTGPEVFLLREENNHEQDTVLKKRWLDSYGKEKILFVVDDRKKVVDMWRDNGLVCLQCADWKEYSKTT